MSKYFYFKVTFFSVAAGLFAGMLVYGLFDVDFSDGKALINLVVKSAVVALISGLLLGVLNMFFKIKIFPGKSK